MRVHKAAVRKARKVASPCKLQFGCGVNIKPGWVNIDLVHPLADLHLDAREPMPFADKCATIVYSEHFFEHLDFHVGIQFLKEAFRVLQPGGLISTGIPDAETVVRAYVSGDPAAWQWGKKQWHPNWCTTPMHRVNFLFRWDGWHKYAYDFETLAEALASCGFVNIQRREWDAKFDAESRRGGTLYVDAYKPQIPG